MLPFPGRNEPVFIGLPRLRGLIEEPLPAFVLGTGFLDGFEGVWYLRYPLVPEYPLPLVLPERLRTPPWLPVLPDLPDWKALDRREPPPLFPPEERVPGEDCRGLPEVRTLGVDCRDPREERVPGEERREPPEERTAGVDFREPPEERARCDERPELPPERDRTEEREDLPEEARATWDDLLAVLFDFEVELDADFDCLRFLPASATRSDPNSRQSERAVRRSDQREVAPQRNGEPMAISQNGGLLPNVVSILSPRPRGGGYTEE